MLEGENAGAEISPDSDATITNKGKLLVNTGTVKFFNTDKAYAFIRLDEGRDVFIHSSWILGDGWQTLEVGHRVEFAPGGISEAQNPHPT